MLVDSTKEKAGPLSDFMTDGTIIENLTPSGRRGRFFKRDQSNVIKDLIYALSLCHNVTPVYPNEDDPT
jgi:hypothetical protein